MSADLLETAKTLPLPERIELFDALWESIAKDGYEPPLSPAQAAELDKRLEAHRSDPNKVVSWDQIKEEAEAKHGRNP